MPFRITASPPVATGGLPRLSFPGGYLQPGTSPEVHSHAERLADPVRRLRPARCRPRHLLRLAPLPPENTAPSGRLPLGPRRRPRRRPSLLRRLPPLPAAGVLSALRLEGRGRT